jgi:hypothetical protein
MAHLKYQIDRLTSSTNVHKQKAEGCHREMEAKVAENRMDALLKNLRPGEKDDAQQESDGSLFAEEVGRPVSNGGRGGCLRRKIGQNGHHRFGG